MRSHNFLLAPFLLALCNCAGGNNDRVQLILNSAEGVDALATCVSQDWEAAFPRFSPSQEIGGGKTFGTYNGIAVSIVPDGQSRKIIVRWAKPLTSEMVGYLRKCADGSFDAGPRKSSS